RRSSDLWSTAASSCRAAARSCWPTPKYAAPTSAPDGAEAFIAGAPPRPGFSYIKTGGSPRTVGAPEAGAKVFWFDSLSHRGRCSYIQTGFSYTKTGFFSNRRSTRPGCEGALARLPFRTGGGAPTSKPGFSYTKTGFFSNRRSTRPGCEGALAWLPFRTEGGAPTSKPGFS